MKKFALNTYTSANTYLPIQRCDCLFLDRKIISSSFTKVAGRLFSNLYVDKFVNWAPCFQGVVNYNIEN